MAQISRFSPAPAADMVEADLQLIAHILEDFRKRCAAIANRCPGGILLPVDMIGPARRTAREHRVTPEDVLAWHKKYPEAKA
ncbi:hypothetical protein QCN27_03785 [Cereibacter sp. SYSU M97828]|nr:hypothetical protein [Cereibacter flavus]